MWIGCLRPLVLLSWIVGQNIERWFDVFPEVRQLREAHHYKARLLERDNVLAIR
jgi:hypothetical protein